MKLFPFKMGPASTCCVCRTILLDFPLLLLLCWLESMKVVGAETHDGDYHHMNSSFGSDFALWWSYARIPIATFVFASFGMTWYFILKYKPEVQAETGRSTGEEREEKPASKWKLKIFYGTQTGTAMKFAKLLKEETAKLEIKGEILNLQAYDPEDELVNEAGADSICIFFISTFTNGQPPEGASWFCQYLKEASDDFRIQKTMLKGLKYTIFGLGSSIYEDSFNLLQQAFLN